MVSVIYRIFVNVIPIILMIGLIPFVQNDYLLAALYSAIITLAFLVTYEKKDLIFLLTGLVVLTISEYFFISTGVEVFERQTLIFGMPLWLPLLWGYAFVVIRRSIVIIDEYLR